MANIGIMIASTDDQSLTKANVLSQMNFALSIIFIAEMVLKLCAFGRYYFLSGWYIFDFFVVMASIMDLVLNSLGLYTK